MPTGSADWSVLILVAAVFSCGAGLAWFISSQFRAQGETRDKKFDELTTYVDKKINEAANTLTTRINGLDVVAAADRVNITAKIENLDLRNQRDHKEVSEQITKLRVAVSALETNKQRQLREENGNDRPS